MLDHLDTSGRFALLKLATGALRIGISARLAKVALPRRSGSTSMRWRRSGTASARPTPDLRLGGGRGPQPTARTCPSSARSCSPIRSRSAGLARRLCRRMEMGRDPGPARPCRRRDPALQPRRRRHHRQLPRGRRGVRREGVLDGELLVKGEAPAAARRRASTRSSSGSAARTSRRRCSATIPPSSGSTTYCSTARRICARLPLTSGAPRLEAS